MTPEAEKLNGWEAMLGFDAAFAHMQQQVKLSLALFKR